MSRSVMGPRFGECGCSASRRRRPGAQMATKLSSAADMGHVRYLHTWSAVQRPISVISVASVPIEIGPYSNTRHS